MTYLATRLSKVLLLSVVVALAGGCAPENVDHSVESRTRAVTAGANPGNLDILFMIDNSPSMSTTQMKLLAQDPSFMTVLENLPNGLPNIHVAVISSDMGAPGDSTASIACTPAGDAGLFQSTPRGTCTNTTLSPGATFISNVGGVANYTGDLTAVFGCIAQLGQQGCGFEHQLASIARALGADGSPPPAANAGFLRDDAELAIVILSNEDDCSAPTITTLFSLNGGQQNVANPLGPIANYRCNQFGHLCTDPASGAPSALIAPPLNPPGDAQGTATAPTLNLTSCESNEGGTSMLTPVANLVAGIRALKADPDNQIVVGAISPPVTPYTVQWLPASSGTVGPQPGELWPQVEHSCGAANDGTVNPLATQITTDGSFGDPGVRIAEWVRSFGSNGVVASICDADYSVSFKTIADKINMHLQVPGTGGAGGAGGIAGGVGGAGGHGNVGGSSGAGGGAAGAGAAGKSGSGTGGTGGSGAAGNGGPGTGGNGIAGAGGNGATTGATGGHVGTGGQSGAGGITGPGTGGSAAAGASGAGAGGSAVAGASGAGTGGSAAAGASGAGAGGSAVAGASGAGTGGVAGHGETGGHAGNGTGGTSVGASGGGCGCDTGGSSPTGTGLALLLGALALLAKRRRGAAVTASSPWRR